MKLGIQALIRCFDTNASACQDDPDSDNEGAITQRGLACVWAESFIPCARLSFPNLVPPKTFEAFPIKPQAILDIMSTYNAQLEHLPNEVLGTIAKVLFSIYPKYQLTAIPGSASERP